MRALCVCSPHNVKYEFSCMLTQESYTLTAYRHILYLGPTLWLPPLATVACGGGGECVYCAEWRVRQTWNHLGRRDMEIKYGLISCDSHAQPDKDAFTSRMSKAKWGDAIPHLAETTDKAH